MFFTKAHNLIPTCPYWGDLLPSRDPKMTDNDASQWQLSLAYVSDRLPLGSNKSSKKYKNAKIVPI